MLITIHNPACAIIFKSSDEIYYNIDNFIHGILDVDLMTEVRVVGYQSKDILPKLSILPNLKKLILTRDWSDHLDNSIGLLTTLTHLSIVSCSYYYLSSNIGNLTNLVELRLLENYIKELPDTISDLTNLIKLDVSGNSLEELNIESFRKMTSLQFVNLSRNKMYGDDKRHYIESLKEQCTVYEDD